MNKSKLLHGTFKASVLDISAFLWAALQSNLTLYASGQKSLILQLQLLGYKSVETPNTHQKIILSNVVIKIYRKKHSHLRMAIGHLIPGDVFFGMISCD